MSTLKVNTINAATSGQAVDVDVKSPKSFRNLVINGGMTINQRNGTYTAGDYCLDRYRADEVTDGAVSITHSGVVPDGFANSLRVAVTTADTSVGSGDAYILKHRIEAQNLARLAYGTSGAKTITLSFWVKSNKTGVYTINLYKHDNTAYNYVREFSISSADTWEKKELTITSTAGSTSLITNSGGAIDIDNGAGLDINFCLSLGSNYTGSTNDSWSSNGNHYGTSNSINWMDSTSNNFYITGVQLECGSATNFEHESYGDTLRKCQRYFYAVVPKGVGATSYFGNGFMYTSSVVMGFIHFPVTMRAVPTLEISNATDDFGIYRNGGLDGLDDFYLNSANIKGMNIANTSDASGTAGHAGGLFISDSTNAYLYIKAEL